MGPFRILALTPGGSTDPAIAIAACRAGYMGVLDLELCGSFDEAGRAVERAFSLGGDQAFGVKVGCFDRDLAAGILRLLPDKVETVLLGRGDPDCIRDLVAYLRPTGRRILLDVTSVREAAALGQLDVDGFVAKGSEAAGWVGEHTTFVLLQELGRLGKPVWAHGGVGLHTIAACILAGANGIVVDSQLLLTRESPVPAAIKAAIARMDGTETQRFGDELGTGFRMLARPGQPQQALADTISELLASNADRGEVLGRWRDAVRIRCSWQNRDDTVWPIGQDACFAAPLAERFVTVGGVLGALDRAIDEHIEAARANRPLAEDGPICRSHGCRYPVAQGPMTRVSDRAEFALAVAQGGGLPFVALALMRGGESEQLLAQTKDLLGERPWGVGILGFVPLELRNEQLAAIRKYRPPFALIAGGRPDQAQALEQDGIATYLHVPAAGLLRLFLSQGARRFVFEGRECGGHVGPLSSFVLWNSVVEVLAELPTETLADCHILFAGGIHDGLSAAMVASVAAPLAARGAKVGVLVGTAYLFTREAVSSGAIVQAFQDQALSCDETVLLESGPGHATRCLDTEYARSFQEEKKRLLKAAQAPEDIRQALEAMNIGRLRIAAKGVDRNPNYRPEGDAPKLLELDRAAQLAQGMYMIGQVAALRSQACSIEELHRDIAVDGTRRLDDAVQVAPQRVATADERPCEVAIVGMSAILPGARRLSDYWTNILAKGYAITEIPPERWDADIYFDADPTAKDKIYSRWGGFIDPIEFDPLDFGMPPSSLRSIDPMQLLALQAAREALEDAGYWQRPFDRSRASVILGASGGTGELGGAYLLRSGLPLVLGDAASEVIAGQDGALPEWSEDSFAGLLLNVAAGRIANRFDFGGTNYVIDAACASSLAAVHQAVRELECQSSDLVIVGGVDATQTPFGYLCFSKTRALSPTGQPRTFDAGADGIVISEGITMLVLKRLADAERDGDRIYAVIQGVGASSDGKAKAMTAPRPEGQMRALERAYAKAGFSPTTVGLFEAHGTGTAVGDQSEVESLSRFLDLAGAKPSAAAVGSVKSMIGHTKASAGVAGLAKIALALHHKVLPPTAGVTEPNPKAGFGTGPLYVNSEARPWIQAAGAPRRAGASAFGFGGTNFHAVVEEYRDHLRPPETLATWPSEVFLFGSETRDGLVADIDASLKSLERGVAQHLADLACAHWNKTNLPADGYRLGLVANSLDGLRDKLVAARAELVAGREHFERPDGIYGGRAAGLTRGEIAFVFPGQGSQYPNMLADLAIHFDEVRGAFERADAWLADRLERPLSRFVFPPPAFTPEETEAQRQAVTRTDVAQPALGAAGVGMLVLLDALGLRPGAVAGHSYGEYPALHAAGVLCERDLVLVSEARGRAIVESANGDSGSMLAVMASAEETATRLGESQDVWLANHNSPRQTILSGTTAGIERAAEKLGAAGLQTRPIPVACAFHSPLVAPAKTTLARFLADIEFAPAQIDAFSNSLAAKYPAQPEDMRALLSEHLVSPVRFSDEILAMYDAGVRLFVEAGPNNKMTGLLGQILGDRAHTAVAFDAPNQAGLTRLQHGLAQAFVAGAPITLDRLFATRALASETSPKAKASPTTWLVDGGGARPANSPQPAQLRPVAIGVRAPDAATSSGSADTADSNRFAAPNPPPAAPPSAGAIAPSSDDIAGVAQVMGQYQELMGRFLETQKRVMLAYLEGRPGASAADGALPAGSEVFARAAQPGMPEMQTAAAARVEPASPHAPPVSTPMADSAQTTPAASSPSAAMDKAELTSRLLDIVSERTGYPPEMLDLDLDLEADLGIDSIKRVEILGSFQQTFAAGELAAAEGLMERLAGLKTLRGIIDLVAEQATATTEAERTTPAPARGPDEAALTTRLLDIVSERTGYPPEMLGLDLDLEADLGIDSIKRVEILGTFQQTFADADLPAEDGLMERLAALKTLRGIIDLVAESFAAPEAAEPAVVGPDKAVLTTRLLDIVSERTGYPPEMLGLDLDLEADLGIDSIKRVEILGTFQETFEGDLPSEEGLMERLASLKTLRGIIDLVSNPVAGGPREADSSEAEPTPPVSPEPDTPAVDPERVGRYRFAPVDAPLEAIRHPLPSGRVLVITDDGTGVAAALAERMREQGLDLALVTADGPEGEHSYCADLGSFEAVSALVEQIHARQGPIGGLIHLLPLGGGDGFDEMDLDAWRGRLRAEVKGLFNLAKVLAADLGGAPAGSACLLAATCMGSALAEAPKVFPGQKGIDGLIKTIALEWPEIRVKAVDLSPHDAVESQAAQVMAELLEGDAAVEVAYAGARRVTWAPTPAPLAGDRAETLDLGSSPVILLTGGARGITARVALRFAENNRPRLLLVGRSPLPPDEEPAATAGLTSPRELKAAIMDQMRERGEQVAPALVEKAYARLLAEREMRDNLAKMRRLGAEVHYYPADVRDWDGFGGLIDRLYERFGRIDAVIHGAGVIEDKLIADKTPESFERTFDTKADSAFILARKLRPESLRLMVFFTSVAGSFGNRGQGDYAAANEVLNLLARRLDREWAARVVAINWGPWETAGMVSPELRRQFQERGVALIPPAVGLKRLEEEIAQGHKGESEVVIGGAGWRQPATAAGASKPIELRQLPMIRRGGLTRVNGSFELVRELDVAKDLYLNHHRLNGSPVLPLAMATELMAETVAAGWPEFEITAITDLGMLKGVVMEQDTQQIRIVVTPQAGVGQAPFQVAAEICGPERPSRVLYRGTVELGERLPAPPIEARPAGGEPLDMDVEAMYREWFFHGPLFQGISRVNAVGEQGMSAELRTSSPHEFFAEPTTGTWLVDPLVFDSALQMIILWSRKYWDMTCLPSRFGSYRRFAAPVSATLRCEARVRPHASGQSIHADFVFRNSNGDVVAVLDGMEGSCSEALNRLVGKDSTAGVGGA